jgi:HEAT repeat protein
VIDVAGEDRYIGGNDFSFGGALGGVAINWDCGGNDVYIGGNCSCGAGILGVGVLVDEGGDDIYRCKDFCEGAGAFGIGRLLEKVGHDFFHADLYGQGYGSTWGCGMLVDLSGNDVYDAGGAHVDTPLWRDRFTSLSQGFGFGMRPDASGGIGVLVDVSGNDRYSCDIFGQGCSYWFSLGLLIDDDGHDTYCCGQYGQGSGIHLSCGMLLDRHGQDCYYDANGVGMGGAHDWAVGVLVDRDGDDYYSGGGCAQGAGHTNSVGILLDDAGDDGYCAVRGTTQGSGSWVRNTGGIGLLLDGAGKDFYSEPTRDGGVVVKDTIGALIDEPTPPETPHADPMNAAISKEDAAKKVEAGGMADGKWDLDKLWALVTAWEVGDNTVIQPIAREKFIALGKPALDRAFENLNAKDSLITRAIELTLKAFPKDDVVPRLVAKTKDADKFVRKNSVAMLAALNATEAVPRLVEMLTTDADTPGTVLAALATMKTAPPVVASMLKHAKETVAVQAAVCLGAVGDDAAIAALVEALGPDYAFPVRIAATDRLAALGAAAVPLLHEIVIFDNAPVMQRRNALKALGASKTIKAAQAISSGLGGRNRWIRLSAMTAAAELIEALAPPKTGEPSAPTDDDSGTQAFRKLLMLDLDHARELETDPLVKHLVLPPAKR